MSNFPFAQGGSLSMSPELSKLIAYVLAAVLLGWIFWFGFGCLGPAAPWAIGWAWQRWLHPKDQRPPFPKRSSTIAVGVGLVLAALSLGWWRIGILNLWLALGVVVLAPGRRARTGARGGSLLDVLGLQKLLAPKRQPSAPPDAPGVLAIGGIRLPAEQEALGVVCFGAPGSGKTVSITNILNTLRDRPADRAIILDRGGELMEKLYRPGDLIFNPYDARSCTWSQSQESANAYTIATALIPESHPDLFWGSAARELMAVLLERCEDPRDVDRLLSQGYEEVQQFVSGSKAAHYFASEKTAGGILSHLISSLRCLPDLPELGAHQPLNFWEWGQSDDPRWIWMPVREEHIDVLRPLLTMGFTLAMRGLLSNESRLMQTWIVIDELAALGKLQGGSANSPSAPVRLLQEGRKFKAPLLFGAQTIGSLERIYGKEEARVITGLPGTKVLFRAADPDSARFCSDLLGKHERLERSENYQPTLFGESYNGFSESLRERDLVLPSEFEQLPKLTAYLKIGPLSPARVEIALPTPKNVSTSRFESR